MDQLDNVFFQALDISPNPLFLLNPEGKVLLWNRSCEEFTGFKAADLLGTDRHKQVFYPDSAPPRPTLADLILEDRQDELADHYIVEQKAATDGEQLRAEGWFFNLGGKDRYITFTAVAIRNQSGDLLAVLETFHDITERRRNKEKLESLFQQVCEAKRQWEETMDCIDDLVLVVDAAGKIQRCNQSVIKLPGVSYDEVLQAEWCSLLEQGGIDFHPVGGKKNECYEPESARWFLLKKYDFRRANQKSEAWTVVTLHDLTEVRRMTTALEQAHAELQATQGQILQSEKMASIGQLAAGVAHEINNPIGFVRSNLTCLGRYVERLAAHIEKQQQALVELAGEAGKKRGAQLHKEGKLDFLLEDVQALREESIEGIDRVSKIVQNLKSFSRVDQAEFSSVNINDCLENTLSIVWNELKYSTTIEKELGTLPLVACFPQQLNQVFLNLLVNAGHAIGEKGVIKLRTWQEQKVVCIAISDTGCGIPKENLPRLFEPFFTTKDVGKGTGLGLSISYDIVKKHGGEIFVESLLGEGTTFTIQLPLQPEAAKIDVS